jgi:hypothetical protein
MKVHQSLTKADELIQSQFLGLHGASPLKSGNGSLIIAVSQAYARREALGGSRNDKSAYQNGMTADEIVPIAAPDFRLFRRKSRYGNGTAVADK